MQIKEESIISDICLIKVLKDSWSQFITKLCYSQQVYKRAIHRFFGSFKGKHFCVSFVPRNASSWAWQPTTTKTTAEVLEGAGNTKWS